MDSIFNSHNLSYENIFYIINVFHYLEEELKLVTTTLINTVKENLLTATLKCVINMY